MEEIRALLGTVLKGAGCGFLIFCSKLGSEQAALHTHGDSQRAQQCCGSLSLLPATTWQHSNKSTSQPGTAAIGELGMLLWRANCVGASVPESRREETKTRIMQTCSWTEQRILLMQAQA